MATSERRILGSIGTAPAQQHRFAPLYRKQRNKKQVQVMIHPAREGLVEPAPGASPGVLIQGFHLWGNATDNKKHALLPGSVGRFFAGTKVDVRMLGTLPTNCNRGGFRSYPAFFFSAALS